MATDNKILEIVIKAKDEASAQLKNISASLSNVGSVAKKSMAMAGKAIAGATVIAVGFGVASLKAYSEAETQMRGVDTVLKNLSKNFTANKKIVMDTADAYKKLGFDGEDTAMSITSLYAKTKNLTEAQKLNVIAMDLARYKNISLSEASKLVGSAYMGNTKVLKDFGIAIDESKSPMDALNEAHRVFQGSAVNSANTIAVTSERIKNAFVDLKENIGQALSGDGLNILGVLATTMERIASADFAGAFKKAKDSISSMFNFITENTSVMTTFKAIWEAITTAFNTIIRPSIEELITTLSKHKVEIVQIMEAFLTLTAWLATGVFITLLAGIKVIIETLNIVIKALVTTMNAMADAFSWAAEKVDKMYSALKRYLTLAKEAGGKVVDKLFGKATGGGVQVGQSYLVGEKGPEMFTPASNGSITPNYALAGAGGGMNLTINMNGGTYLDNTVAEQIGDRIVQNFKRIARF